MKKLKKMKEKLLKFRLKILKAILLKNLSIEEKIMS